MARAGSDRLGPAPLLLVRVEPPPDASGKPRWRGISERQAANPCVGNVPSRSRTTGSRE
jgi:hypothetical protein